MLAKIVRVRVERDRETGLLHATSCDVPGLCLSHYDADFLRAQIPGVIAELYRLSENMDFEVVEAEDLEGPDILGSWVAIPPHIADNALSQ